MSPRAKLTNSFATRQSSCAVNFRLSHTRRTSQKIDVSRTSRLAHAHLRTYTRNRMIASLPALSRRFLPRRRDASGRLLHLTRCQLTWSNDGRYLQVSDIVHVHQRRSNIAPYSAARRYRAYRTHNDTVSILKIVRLKTMEASHCQWQTFRSEAS